MGCWRCVMAVSAPFAALSDLASWRTLTGDEFSRVEGLLDEASQVILEVFGVPERIAAGLLVESTLRSVCVQMVLRVLVNPQRLTQFSVSVEDVSRSGTYESPGVPAGVLAVTPGEVDRLLGQVELPGAFTAMPPALLVPSAQDAEFPTGLDTQWTKIYLLDPSN